MWLLSRSQNGALRGFSRNTAGFSDLRNAKQHNADALQRLAHATMNKGRSPASPLQALCLDCCRGSQTRATTILNLLDAALRN